MTLAERLNSWNRWYDSMPQEWQFQLILWPLIAIAAINMALTVAIGFPFGLLLLIGIIFFAGVRIPYLVGWITPAAAVQPGKSDAMTFEIEGAGWLVDLNRQYDAIPEPRRLWVFPAILLIAGAINMVLTIAAGFPFGLLFLLAILALVALRAPYAGGVLKSAPVAAAPSPAVEFRPGFAAAAQRTITAEPTSEVGAMPSVQSEMTRVNPEATAEPRASAEPPPLASRRVRVYPTPAEGSPAQAEEPHVPLPENDQPVPPHDMPPGT